MKSALEYVKLGFCLASGRPHMVILDMSAKLAWLLLSFGVFAAAGIWFAANVPLGEGEISALESGIPALRVAALLGAVLQNAPTLLISLGAAAGISLIGWVFLEAFVRAGMLWPSDRSFLQDATGHFSQYLWTGLLNRTVLALATALTLIVVAGPVLTEGVGEWGLIWPELRWALLAGCAILTLLAVGLVTLETLVRSDAVSSLGPEFCRIVGVILTLISLEAALVLTATAAGIALIQTAASVGSLIGTVVLLLGFLSVNHSYLLLVRYSAIGVLRRDMEHLAQGKDANDL